MTIVTFKRDWNVAFSPRARATNIVKCKGLQE
jgi:hypothetical protein